MKKRLIVISLLTIAFACSTPKPEENNQQGGNKEPVAKVAMEEELPYSEEIIQGDDTLRADIDTVSLAWLGKIKEEKKYHIDVTKATNYKFCATRSVDSPAKMMVTIFYNEQGLKGARVIAKTRLTGSNSFSIGFTPPKDGTITILIEEWRGIGWKNLTLAEDANPPSCCAPDTTKTAKKLLSRTGIKSTDGTGSQVTVSVEQ